MPRFLLFFITLTIIDVLAVLFKIEMLEYIIRTILPLSTIGFYIYRKKQFSNESFFIVFLVLLTLLTDILFLRNRNRVNLFLTIVAIKEFVTIVLIYQEFTTKIPKIFKLLGQLLIYLGICFLIFIVLVPSKVTGYLTLEINFILMAVVFTIASFRKVNNDSFKAVFLGLFLALFGGIFGIVDALNGHGSFAHVIDRVLHDLSLYFIVYGFIINRQATIAD